MQNNSTNDKEVVAPRRFDKATQRFNSGQRKPRGTGLADFFDNALLQDEVSSVEQELRTLRHYASRRNPKFKDKQHAVSKVNALKGDLKQCVTLSEKLLKRNQALERETRELHSRLDIYQALQLEQQQIQATYEKLVESLQSTIKELKNPSTTNQSTKKKNTNPTKKNTNPSRKKNQSTNKSSKKHDDKATTDASNK